MPSVTVASLASDYPAGRVIADHAHDAHQIVHAVEGVMRVTAQNRLWVIPPGRGLWMPAEMVHKIQCVGAVKFRTIYLTGQNPNFSTIVQAFHISNLMREVLIRLSEGISSPMTRHLSAIMIDEFAQSNALSLVLPMPEGTRITRMGEAFLSNPGDQATVNDWAKRLGYSPRTLIRRVKQETGMSFREYRRQARILAALEPLSAGVSVTNVALDVGYESPSAFVQSFKAVTGRTPGYMFSPEN